MKQSQKLILFCLLFLGVGMVACEDSGLDPETAEVTIGDGDSKDSGATTLLDLQKATVEAGFVGEESKVVTEFVNFRRLARYEVETLDDSTVIGLRKVNLVAEISDNASGGSTRQRLSPLRLIRVTIPRLSVGPTGIGKEMDLTDDPESPTLVTGGIKAVLENNDVLVTDADDRFNNWGAAQIVSVNELERKIILRVKADLLNRASSSPLPPVRRLTLSMVMELPY